jgi:hypothetical protein
MRPVGQAVSLFKPMNSSFEKRGDKKNLAIGLGTHGSGLGNN